MSSRYDIVLNSIDHIIEHYQKSKDLNTLNNLNIFKNFINRIITSLENNKMDTYELPNNQHYIKNIFNTLKSLEAFQSMNTKTYVLMMELVCSTLLIRKIDLQYMILENTISENTILGKMRISDIIFKNIIYHSVISLQTLIRNQNSEVIISYKRFNILASRYSHEDIEISDIKYFARSIIPKYHDYFIQSLQENPELWVNKHNKLWNKLGKPERNIMLDNLSWNWKVLKHATINSCLPFVSHLLHYNTLFIINEKKINRYSEELHNKHDNVYIMNIKDLSKVIAKLIKKQRMIKQARYYLPSDFGKSKEHSLIKLWKLNFMRMFEYNKNLDMIRNAAY